MYEIAKIFCFHKPCDCFFCLENLGRSSIFAASIIKKVRYEKDGNDNGTDLHSGGESV